MLGLFKNLTQCQYTKIGCICNAIITSKLNLGTAQSMFLSQEERHVKKINLNNKQFKDWSQEDLAMMTETENCIPLVEAIMSSPLFIEDWEKMPKSHLDKYAIMSDVFSHESIQSVNVILKNTVDPMREVILNQWKKKMINKLGEKEFSDYQNNSMKEGRCFHKLLQDYLRKEISIEGDGSDEWNSVKPILHEISPESAHNVEANVIHPKLFYSGRLDCVVEYKNKLCIIDWKLASKRKDNLKDLYDVPYQVAAYVGAFNILNDSSTQVSNAIIVRGYRNGSPASVHYLNDFAIEFYWKGWLRKLARNHARQLSAQLSQDS
uniref:mitochondrial genome maintenance exonuclease 1-like n=1 Tax=Styela clava TaxID=7725 RepID=UPI0019393077|nr:mitochondrial genome maintenance exonuclease 1-like [Styela clava]